MPCWYLNIRPWKLPSKSFTNYHSLVTLSFDAVWVTEKIVVKKLQNIKLQNVYMVMNIRVPVLAGNVTSWVTISFSRRTLLHGVRSKHHSLSLYPLWENHALLELGTRNSSPAFISEKYDLGIPWLEFQAVKRIVSGVLNIHSHCPSGNRSKAVVLGVRHILVETAWL
jgi:hypothetical protein